jgi:predicted 2-oxoglutarate/Fe(II)-dependent dioxygenase YbiX
MKKIDTKYNIIHSYEDVMSKEECDAIYNFTLNSKKDNTDINSNKMPWETSDTINPATIQDEYIKNIIIKNIKILTEIVSNDYNQQVYNHFTDIVLWRKGKKMQMHTDDGSNHTDNEEGNIFAPRHYSAVAYINDNYTGGKTFIRLNENETYHSNIKAGSVLIFTSDQRCPHGVTEVTDGNRVTLASWFTRDKDKINPFLKTS